MKSNILGDIRAENDKDMLSRAFFETPDYKTLVASDDRCIVVGRRGTGKSALVNKLDNHWASQKSHYVICVSPQEDQIIGLRGLFKIFSDEFTLIKAASKIAWKYALYMEIASKLNNNYKLKKIFSKSILSTKLHLWNPPQKNLSAKLRDVLKDVIDKDVLPEENIADLVDKLDLYEIETALSDLLEESKQELVLLIDCLDEGYTPDVMGVGICDGFVQAVIDLNSRLKGNARGIVFLRDNMFRSIAINDPDFTRNIEGQVLRLHWDEYGLYNMVCNRLKVAHSLGHENTTKIWNTFSAREMKGRDGFRHALRLTLYRPRDILVLLNNAFLNANSQDRKEIILSDIEHSAKSISDNRLIDLIKEYESIFPSLRIFTSVFTSGSAEVSKAAINDKISEILNKDDHKLGLQRDIAIFEDPDQVLQRLYSIGFLGLFDEASSSFVFCHDGREPTKEVSEDTRILIHPCYWLALNLKEDSLEKHRAEEIYDEYDIEISSISAEQRTERIGKIIEEIKSIKKGTEGCVEFEDWALGALRLIFAGSLSNIELHPNKNGRQQRDIVATNMATTPLWRRIVDDYKTRQVVFEVKNFDALTQSEYRQINTYLNNEHGTLGFFITRCNDNNLEKGKELDWAQELYFNQGKKIVIKLSEKYLVKHLSKLRSPQKHDAAEKELNKLLDTYLRQYLILKAK